VTGIPAVRGANLALFLWHFLPYWLASQAAYWYVAWGKSSLRGIIIGFGSFPVLPGALLTAIRGRPVHFAVTAKQRNAAHSRWPLWPHGAALLCCLAALCFAVGVKGMVGSMLVSVLWVVYTMLMLGGMLWLARASARAKRGVRWSPERSVRWWPIVVRSAVPILRPALAIVAITTVTGLVSAPRILARHPIRFAPIRFAPRQEMGRHPYLGISVPAELLTLKRGAGGPRAPGAPWSAPALGRDGRGRLGRDGAPRSPLLWPGAVDVDVCSSGRIPGPTDRHCAECRARARVAAPAGLAPQTADARRAES
jgi:hypothetical protein